MFSSRLLTSTPQPYPGHDTPPPQMGQGYRSSPTPWGAPPGGQTSLFLDRLRGRHCIDLFYATYYKTSLCKKIGFICLLIFHISNTLIYMSFRAQDHNKAAGRYKTSMMPS
jgi:hypothetical protein